MSQRFLWRNSDRHAERGISRTGKCVWKGFEPDAYLSISVSTYLTNPSF